MKAPPHQLTLGNDVFNVFSIQLTNNLVESVVVRLDAHAVQDLLDVLGAGGGVTPEGSQQVGGDVAHRGGVCGGGGEASRVRAQRLGSVQKEGVVDTQPQGMARAVHYQEKLHSMLAYQSCKEGLLTSHKQ